MAYIDRDKLSGLIPENVTREIVQGAVESSSVLSMGRRLPNMASAIQVMNVLDMLPTAYWVNGDTGQKQTTAMAWNKKKIYAEELAVIVPIPENVLDDSNYDIWGEIRPRLVEAFGKKIDAAILFGSDKPSQWREGVVPSAIAAGSIVPATNNIETDLLGVDGLIAKVEESGYRPTGAMGAIKMRAVLRGWKDTTGQPIFKSTIQGTTEYAIDGTPIVFPANGAFDEENALMVLGDFSQLVYAIRKDMTFKIFTEGVVQDGSGAIVHNLMQNDMVALRAVMRLGWEIPNPINAYNAENVDRFPFAVYVPATATPVVTITPSKTSVAVGATKKLKWTTNPPGSTVTWASSATSKATVSAGVVTGVAAGEATITGTITVNGTSYSDTVAVTVT